MKAIKITALALTSLFFTSCGDSHEDAMEDQIDIMTEMAEILNGVADGDDAEDAAEDLKELGEKSEKILARMEELGELDKEMKDEMKEKYKDELTKAAGEFQAAMIRVATSGKEVKVLKEAINSIKIN